MLILDTHVVSELCKAKAGKADRNLARRAAGVPVSAQFVSAINILELETVVLLVLRRDPQQGALLRTWLDHHVLPAFSDRAVTVDSTVAQRCAALHAPAPRSERDAPIAATALVHGMTVATRDPTDFETTRVLLPNPWQAAVQPGRR